MDKLPKGWNYRKLEDVVTYQKKLGIFNLPYIGMEHIESKTAIFIGSLQPLIVKSATFNFTEKDVLYGRLRPYLCKVLIPTFSGHCSTEIFPIRANSDLNKHFLKYWLLSENTTKEIVATCTGTRMPRANMNKVQKLKIPLPPLPEQTQIVSKLDALFAHIDKSINLLEENIKHTKKLMASVLEQLFEKLKSKSTIYKIKEIAEIKGGKRLPKGESIQDEKTDYPYIRVTDFTNDGTIDVNSVKFMTKSVHEQIKRYVITSKDLYISIAGTIGKTGIIPKELENANLTENAARLVFKSNLKINNRFVYYFTLSDNFKDQVGLATKVVAQPKLALTRLAEVELPIPSIEIQNKEVKVFDELSRKFQEINAEQLSKLAYLKALKSSILDRAFKGEL